ncbi:hypothetical protein CGLO_17064 [Colletotrichum gloeosporioides Cg-14]|uniref:Uncharacterized protein n=1 Tax=Colletotrichum gloeosporioides (strain Cg-14) TaxID=1237896 RepID=T0L7C5_COLGC|nr:hypothetical protein CGLO_17064 [Colletotrichum gloeosporioides Cg-14]
MPAGPTLVSDPTSTELQVYRPPLGLQHDCLTIAESAPAGTLCTPPRKAA